MTFHATFPSMYCTSCGAANAMGAAFCGRCGTAAHAPAAQPVAQPPASSGAWWAIAGIAAIFLAALAPALFVYPWHSLMDTADGGTLVGDAAIGLLVGGAMLVGGILVVQRALADETRGGGAWGVLGIAGAIGLVIAISLTSEAWRLAHTTITNGSVNGAENVFVAAAMFSFLALVGLGIAMIPSGDRKHRFVVAAGAMGVAAGGALAAACAWTLWNASVLQRAAASRVRNETPGVGLALVVLSIAVVAYARRAARLR